MRLNCCSPARMQAHLHIPHPDNAMMHLRLTPPGTLIFLISLVLAGAALIAPHMHVPMAGHFVAKHQFAVMAAAYAALLAGVIFVGL
jgi:hypothetical protein